MDTSLALAGLYGIHAGWGIEINGRFEAERPPALAGSASDGRAAILTPLSPMTFLSSSSYNLASVPGSKFGFVKLLGSLDPHCT